jgi:predicted SnoaL-like aldol condensation-catalyzing enzyme
MKFNNNGLRALSVGLMILSASFEVSAQGYLSPTESNKKLVYDFYRLVIEPRNADLIEVYIAPDFADHSSGDLKGAARVLKMLSEMGPPTSTDVGASLSRPPALVMAQGDLVLWFFKAADKVGGKDQMQIEAYRIKDHKIVEHWAGIATNP